VGRLVKGQMDATTKDELTDRLRRMGYMTTQVQEALPGLKWPSVFENFWGVGTEEMVMFNFQLSNMIHAGMSLLASLSVLGEQIEKKKLAGAVGEVAKGVESGDSFSEALSRQPRIFSQLLVSMVKAGEASGKLDTILARFAVYAEGQADLKEKIKGAIFYPIILLSAGLLVTLMIVTFLIPQFAEIFTKAGLKLPLPTRILYQVGVMIQRYWYLIIGLGIVFWGVLWSYGRTSAGRLQYDSWKLRAPLLGPLYRKAAISRFARTFAMLIGAGVPILQSLDMVKDVVGNQILTRIISNVRGAVEKGERLSEPLKVSGEFPPDAVQMIASGEETGSLDEMLDKVADFYDRSVGYSIKKLTTLLEPILLAFLGCLVGFIMASMLLPMFDMMKLLRHARAGF
jgi:type IV pilus assembly protein PilC